MTPRYISRKGKEVQLTITKHASIRFRQRWSRLYNEPVPEDIDLEIAMKFNKASQVKNLSRHEKKRKKRHNDDVLYFRNGDLTFIVRDAKIITIEISTKEKRALNKRCPEFFS